jgi:tripartite ATP-independent transporter DctP family solute receptor
MPRKEDHMTKALPLLIACLLLASAAPAPAADMTLGNINPAPHLTTKSSDVFVRRLGELTGGAVKVTHHHSGVLGGEREVAQQIQLGQVDFGPITAAPLSTLVPEMSAFQLPYLFRDYPHVYAALDGSDVIRKYYEPILDAKGFRLLGFIAAGYRGIYGHYPINGIADVKGKKVRVQEDKILVATFKALGMIPTAIAFPEVATSLQTRVIDFAEGGINTYYHNKFYDIIKNVADVRHTHQVIVLIMSKASWTRQTPEVQKAIVQAARDAEAWNRNAILEDRDIQAKIRAKGVSITKPDPTPFRDATRSVYEEFYATPPGKSARKVVDHILSVK